MNCIICNSKLEDFKLFDKIYLSSAHLYANKNKIPEYVEQIIGFCSTCLHITNYNSDIEIYKDKNYVVKKTINGVMSNNLKNIINFIEENKNTKQSILEVGSGSGEIANYFSNQGNSVDTIDPHISSYENVKINHHQQFLDETFKGGPYDLIIARHVLEHTKEPIKFLKICNSLINDNGLIYIEVPNVETTLKQNRLVDFFNDHIQHFSRDSLTLAGSLAGLQVLKVKNILNNAHQGFIFKKNSKTNILQNLIASKIKTEKIISQLTEKFTIYGAGAHAVTFIGLLEEKHINNLVSVLDKDLNKINKYLPGTSVAIKSPEKIETKIVINTSILYKKEVESFLRKELMYTGKIIHL